MRMRALVLAGCLVCLASIDAVARPAPAAALGPNRKPARGPTLESARKIADAALAVCQERGHPIGVSVVDTEGLAKVTFVADGSWARAFVTVRKANAAMTYRMTGAALEAKLKADPQFAAAVKANPEVQPTAGSAPLMIGGEVVGGIGISGADHDADQACADTAVSAVAIEAR